MEPRKPRPEPAQIEGGEVDQDKPATATAKAA